MSDHDHPIIHMVGSIPLDDAEAVFRTLGSRIGAHVERIPDGETGRRQRWISFINDQLKASPAFEIDTSISPFQFTQYDGKVVYEIERLTFVDGADPAAVEFQTGYADDAIRNYATFDALQADGTIPAGVKYQICMATPLAIAYNFMVPSVYEPFIEIYTAHLADEFSKIAAALPHDRISYQWDVCQEVLMWEGYYDQFPGYRDQIFSVLGRIGDMVPNDMDVGYHLCYGSPKDEHMILPKDMTNLVDIANGIVAAVSRPVQYIHMPVPKERNDDDYFKPLTGLKLPAATALYLGLIHVGDAAASAGKLKTAQKYATISGVAAECGLGRGDPAKFEPILDDHLSVVG
jgi:hypothetical protein